MKVRFLIGVVSLLAPLWADAAPAESVKEATRTAPESSAEAPTPPEVEAWMRQASPSEGHRRLESLAGEWNLKVKYILPDPNKVVETNGRARFVWIMGGRFLIEEAKTDIMGEPFEWLAVHGFDNERQKYTAVWFDNLGTSIDRMDGRIDESGKRITYASDPSEGASRFRTRSKTVLQMADKDRITITVYDLGPGGKDTASMEIVGTRAP